MKVLLVALCLALMLAPVAAAPTPPADRKTLLAPGGMAPAWVLVDVNGQAVRSDQFKGKVVLLHFWISSSARCRAEVPELNALQEKYAGDGLVVVGVSLDRKRAAQMKRFVEANGIRYQVAMGTDALAEAFGGGGSLPVTFLIDREGRVVHRKTGPWPNGQYEQIVKRCLVVP